MGVFKGGGGWSLSFTRPFNDWEVEVQSLLLGKRVLSSQEDMMLMKEARDESFPIKLLYKV